MQIDVITIFPEMVQAMLEFSILKRARGRGAADCARSSPARLGGGRASLYG